MGLFGKTIMVGIILGAIIYGALYFGIISTGNFAIEKVDKSFGLNNSTPIPEPALLGAYEGKLGEVIFLNQNEKNYVDAKLEVVRMQKAYLEYVRQRNSVDLEYVSCGPSSAGGKMKSTLTEGIFHGANAQGLMNQIKANKIGNVSAAALKDFAGGQILQMQSRLDAFEKIC